MTAMRAPLMTTLVLLESPVASAMAVSRASKALEYLSAMSSSQLRPRRKRIQQKQPLRLSANFPPEPKLALFNYPSMQQMTSKRGTSAQRWTTSATAAGRPGPLTLASLASATGPNLLPLTEIIDSTDLPSN